MKLLKQLASILVIVAVLVPVVGLAQLKTPPNNFGLPGGPGSTVTTEVTRYVNLFLGIVGLIAVIFIIYGGFRYITAGGNEESAESAKRIITNAIIGLVVIILAYVVVTVIINAVARNVA